MVDFTRTETESSQSSCSEFDFYSDSESIDDQDLELHEFSIPAAQSRRRSSEMPNACVDRLQVRISSRSYSKTPSFSKSSSSTNDPSSFNFRSSTSTSARPHAVEANLTAKKEYDDDFVPKTSTRRAESVLVSSRSTLGGVSFRFEQAPLQRNENSSSAYLTQDENSSLYSRLANLTRQLNNIDCIITSFEDLFSSGRRTLRPLASIINHELEQLKGSVHQLRCEGSALLRVYSDKVYATQLLSGVQRYVMHAKNTSARIDLLIVAIGSFKIRS
ncbi:unnamed protein product [Albugo candida]|nr:unnamed protein product [Albugo candida]|eukprot:CCI47360.1 unnamed protein product [Albugo candida]